jgi:hypothetical protein
MPAPNETLNVMTIEGPTVSNHTTLCNVTAPLTVQTPHELLDASGYCTVLLL